MLSLKPMKQKHALFHDCFAVKVFDYKLVYNTYVVVFTGNLRIWNVQVIDQGTYICQADNHIGTRAAAQMNLRVLGIVFFPILRYSHPLISCTIILKSSTINILRYSFFFFLSQSRPAFDTVRPTKSRSRAPPSTSVACHVVVTSRCDGFTTDALLQRATTFNLQVRRDLSGECQSYLLDQSLFSWPTGDPRPGSRSIDTFETRATLL